jgi:hypothetical protein
MPKDPRPYRDAVWVATRRGARAAIAAAVAATLGCAPALAPAEESNPISPAETMLFMAAHLENVQPPRRLHYAFRKSGTLEPGFSDTVDIDITGAADESRKATVRFFSGERRIPYPEVEHVQGNPVLLFYLEREIKEMTRLTGGKAYRAYYFQRRIRSALADAAQIKDVDIRYNGRTIRARQITISPYESDPNRDHFAGLSTKQYVFTLSDEIPGRIYQLRGYVPPASGSDKDEAVLEETLTFQSAAPLH